MWMHLVCLYPHIFPNITKYKEDLGFRLNKYEEKTGRPTVFLHFDVLEKSLPLIKVEGMLIIKGAQSIIGVVVIEGCHCSIGAILLL